MPKSDIRPLVVSCGDPSGIGPDVILGAWTRRKTAALSPFFVLADPELMTARAGALGLNVQILVTRPETANESFEAGLPVVPLDNCHTHAPGTPLPENAPGVIEAIERAAAYVLSGEASAVVTAPIAKKPLYEAGFAHPGHTEFLGELASTHEGHMVRPVMMLAGPELRTVPVTVHIPLSRVPFELDSAAIVEVATITAHDLRRRFAISAPRLAVAGLNPHAGEGGALGLEGGAIVRPAVDALVSSGIDACGPLPADTMFHPAARATYDAAICMYHDQALIPAKALAFDETVNVTLGLPFVRTSPDHGTAFDIAGSGRARPDSMVAALKLARRLADAEAG